MCLLTRARTKDNEISGPLLGGVLFGASVAVPFWLVSGLLLGLAPIFAWSGRAAKGNAFAG